MKQGFFFSKRFFPLFWVQFLGAFNDNLFKNALVMLITFRLAETPEQAGMMITLAAGIFILPFFLFSAFAGQLADKYEKSLLIRKIKLSEILIMLLGAWGLWMQHIELLFAVLFLMGVQSAFFGPIKYSILPEHLSDQHLLDGNGWFSASTFVAILIGTLAGGWVVLSDGGETDLAIAVLCVALLGYVASRFVPEGSAGDASLTVKWNLWRNTYHEMQLRHTYPQAFFAVLAISWFWFLGATYLSQIPVLVADVLHGDDKVVLLFLTVFSLGIGLGAWLAGRFQQPVRRIENVRWLVAMLMGMSVLMVVANLAMGQVDYRDHAIGVMDFIQTPAGMMVLLSMGLVAALGGLFTVPLYTLLQVRTPQSFRSRMVAVNNITNALLMVLSSLLIMGLYALGWDLIAIFYTVALLNLVMAAWYWQRSASLASG
ncbi:MAG: MFS transporter [Hydrogenovibrio sp.]